MKCRLSTASVVTPSIPFSRKFTPGLGVSAVAGCGFGRRKRRKKRVMSAGGMGRCLMTHLHDGGGRDREGGGTLDTEGRDSEPRQNSPKGIETKHYFNELLRENKWRQC